MEMEALKTKEALEANEAMRKEIEALKASSKKN